MDAAGIEAAAGRGGTRRLEAGARGRAPCPVLVGPGLLERAHLWARPALPGARRLLLVSDGHVAPLHLERLERGLAPGGFETARAVVEPGEGEKSFAGLERLCDAALAAGIDRESALVALGGGVVGDLAGLAAALLLRGLPVVQAPTTLLAQCDSSVGGKTAIDTARGKNLVGAFHPPALVLCDADALATLPRRERASGLAEVAKCALAFDEALLERLEGGLLEGALEGRAEDCAEAVAAAVSLKAAAVRDDPEDRTGRRALLNLGHTFAHALEAALGYDDRLRHGEAVAAGLVLAARLSERTGAAAPGLAARAAALLARAGLPTSLAAPPLDALEPEALLGLMRGDKKSLGGEPRFVLLRGAGRAFFPAQAAEGEVLAALRESRAGAPGAAGAA